MGEVEDTIHTIFKNFKITFDLDTNNLTYSFDDSLFTEKDEFIHSTLASTLDTGNGPPIASTPLPGALPFFVGGLGVIGLFGRHRKSKKSCCRLAVMAAQYQIERPPQGGLSFYFGGGARCNSS